MNNNFIVSIYNKLDDESAYHSDIFDLFGTPDGFKEGLIGKKLQNDFKCIRWDWGRSGFKKIMKFIYYNELQRSDIREFENWYKSELTNNFADTSSILNTILYVFKYKNRKIPAFIASVRKIEYVANRIWLTFSPIRYFLLPPEFDIYFRDKIFDSRGIEDPKKLWDYLFINKDMVKEICSSASTLDQYHVIPIQIIKEWMQSNIVEGSKPFFVADVTENKKRLKKNLKSNNQIFWDILSEYIGNTQIKATIQLIYNERPYLLTDIKVNTVVDNGLVYTHEVGVPKVICEVMKEVFGENYLSKEFNKGNEKKISDSIFIKRSVKLKEMNLLGTYNSNYENTDYDYILDLAPLGINKKIVFDLTCGLWHKGKSKTKEEYVEQWKHNIFDVPTNNNNIFCIWHYGLKGKIEEFNFNEIGTFLNKEYYSNSEVILKNTNIGLLEFNDKKIFVMPFYKGEVNYHDFNTEFSNLHPQKDQFAKTLLYKLLKHLLVTLKINFRVEKELSLTSEKNVI